MGLGMTKATCLSSSSLPSSFHCVDSLGQTVSGEARWTEWSGRTGQGQATGLKLGPEGGLSRGGLVWEL